MPFPKRFPDRDEIAAVRAEAEQLEPGATDGATKRRLAGRVMARRDMGKLVFLDLVDRSGRIQLICPAERTGELDLHLGDIVGVTGSPARSRRGEPSLQVDELEALARIRAPLPDTFHGIEDVELRYRKRYLDLLMSEESRDEAVKRARMVSAIRAYLDGEGSSRSRRRSCSRATAAASPSRSSRTPSCSTPTSTSASPTSSTSSGSSSAGWRGSTSWRRTSATRATPTSTRRSSRRSSGTRRTPITRTPPRG